GTCDIISASVGLTDDDVTNCELADGGWGITAVQVNAGGSSALGSLAISIDAIAPTVRLASGNSSLAAGGATTITVSLSEASATALTVGNISLSPADGGTLSEFTPLASGTDYTVLFTAAARRTAISVTISLAAGEVTDIAGNNNVAGFRDILVEALGTPVINIGALDSEVTEGQQPRFTLNANPQPETELTVNLSFTHTGAFILPNDPDRRPPAAVVIPANVANHLFSITTEDTDAAEQNGSVTLRVEAGSGYRVGSQRSSSVVIVSDERPLVAEAAADEGEDLLFVLTRTVESTNFASVTYVYQPVFTGGPTAIAADLIPAHRGPRTLMMPVGQRTATLTVTTMTDELTEPAEYFLLSVSSGGPAFTAAGIINANTGDASLPAVSVSFEVGGSTVTEVDEGSTFDTVFRFNTPPDSPNLAVQIYYTGEQVSGYIPAHVTGAVRTTFATDGVATVHRVSVTAFDDDQPGRDGRYVVTLRDDDLSDPRRANPGVRQYDLGSQPVATLIIRNDEASVPAISVSSAPGIIDNAITEDRDLAFRIASTLPIPSDDPLTVLLLLEATGGDYIVGTFPRTIRLPVTGNGYDLTLAVVDDDLDEPNGIITATVQAGSGYDIGRPAGTAVTIVDGDAQPRLRLTEPLRPADEQAGGDSLEFVLELRDTDSLHASNYTITVDYATSDGIAGTTAGARATAGSDYTGIGGTLTFVPGENQKTLTVSVLNDNRAEPAEGFSLLLSNLQRATFERGVSVATGIIAAPGMPSVLIKFDNDRLRVGESTTVRMIASKRILGFTIDDVIISSSIANPGRGVLTNFVTPVHPDLEFTATFTATQLGLAVVLVAPDAFLDENGVGNLRVGGLVNIVRPPPGVPTIDLLAASDTGRDPADNITGDNQPAFLISDLDTRATVTVEATGPDGGGYRKTLIVPGSTATAVSVAFGNPGLGGNCDRFAAGGGQTAGNQTACALPTDGDWTITATQSTDGGTSEPGSLTINLDTVRPRLTLANALNLAAGSTASLVAGGATTITVNISEDTTGLVLAADFSVTPAGAGTLSNLARVANSNNYTMTFNAGAKRNPFTAIIAIATGAIADTAGNNSPAAPPVLIAVDAAVLARPEEVYLIAASAMSMPEGMPDPRQNFRLQIVGGSAPLGSMGGSPPIGTEIKLSYEVSRVPRTGELLRGDIGCLFSAPETVAFSSATGFFVDIIPAQDDVWRGNCTITATLVPTDDYITPESGITANNMSGVNTLTYTMRDDERNRPGNRPPGVNIAAPDSVIKGETITFTLNVNIGLRSAKTVNVSYSTTADILATTPPATVVFPAGTRDQSFDVVTGGSDPFGSIILSIEGGTGYIVQANLMHTRGVRVERVPSTQPTIDLNAASDTGVSDSDNVTKDFTPTFTLGNMVANSTILVQAQGPDLEISPGVFEFDSGRVISKTLVTSSDDDVTIVFDNPGAGGQCLITDRHGTVTGPQDACAFAATADEAMSIGEWTLTVTQTEVDKGPVSAGLLVQLDTLTGPTAFLTTGDLNETLVGGSSKYITVIISEHSDVDATDVSNNDDGGVLSDFSFVRVRDDGRIIYRFLYTAPVIASLPDGSDTYSDFIRILAAGFTDLAGNTNTASNALRIFVAVNPAHSAPPTITAPAPADGAVSNFVTVDNQRAFPVSGTRPVADSSIMIDVLRGGDLMPVTVPPNSASPLTWATTLDLSGLADGDLLVTVRASETGGLPSTIVTAPVHKDTVAPTATFTGLPMVMLEGTTATNITVTLSEAATDFEEGDLTFTGSGGPENFTIVSSTEYTFDFVAGPIRFPGTVVISVGTSAFTDSGLNGNVASDNYAVRINEIPAVHTVQQGSGGEGDNVPFVVARNKPVVVPGREDFTYTLDFAGQRFPADADDFPADALTGSGVISVGQINHTFNVATMEDADFEQDETFIFIASVNGSEFGRATGIIHNDEIAPAPSISAPVSGTYVNVANVSAFRVSGGSTALSAAISLVISDGTNPDVTSRIFAVGGSWSGDVDLSSLADGPLSINATAQDLFSVIPSAAVGVAVRKDATAPRITIAPSVTSIALGQRAEVAFRLNDATAVSFEVEDISILPVGSGRLTDFIGADNGMDYSATLVIPGSVAASTLTISVAASAVTDQAGNTNLLATDTLPIITGAPTIIVPAAGGYVNIANQGAFTVSGFARENTAISVTVRGTDVSATTTADSRFNWSVSLDLSASAITDGAYVIAVVGSLTGREQSAAATVNVTKDTDRPRTTFSNVPVTINEGSTATGITVTVSEATTSLTAGTFTISGSGSLVNFTAVSDRVYTFDLVADTYMHPGLITLALPLDSYGDLAGNGNAFDATSNIRVNEMAAMYSIADGAGVAFVRVEEGDPLEFVVRRGREVLNPAGLILSWGLSLVTTPTDPNTDPAAADDFNSADQSGTVTIASGDDTATLTVRTLDDTDFEQTEVIELAVTEGTTEVARGQGIIQNNDTPPAPEYTMPTEMTKGTYVNAANATRVTVAGTSAARGATMEVSVRQHGLTQSFAIKAATNGNWSLVFNLGSLGDGFFDIQATAQDTFSDRSPIA
ncbi:MAG: Ig-like domain-containing protein, partial [Pseudohongiellaceae bacterium]